jgi:hypothetical protein
MRLPSHNPFIGRSKIGPKIGLMIGLQAGLKFAKIATIIGIAAKTGNASVYFSPNATMT